MTETTLAMLRRLLVDRYDDYKARLAQRLGSVDLASDAMQDAWVKLAQADAVGTVRDPHNYLFRVVLNAALDRRQVEGRLLSATEIENLLDLVDETPGPAHVAEERSELRALEAALAKLPARRRDILLAARLDGLPRQEIARRLGVSLRLVEKELHLAQAYCLAHLTQTG
jgi:RNA polymerase sigma-70 factor (ECF subfamily)